MISSCRDSNYIPKETVGYDDGKYWSLISFPLGEFKEQKKGKTDRYLDILNIGSPVLIPSVGKLDEKHQLDDEEEKTSSGPHITPD